MVCNVCNVFVVETIIISLMVSIVNSVAICACLSEHSQAHVTVLFFIIIILNSDFKLTFTPQINTC